MGSLGAIPGLGSNYSKQLEKQRKIEDFQKYA